MYQSLLLKIFQNSFSHWIPPWRDQISKCQWAPGLLQLMETFFTERSKISPCLRWEVSTHMAPPERFRRKMPFFMLPSRIGGLSRRKEWWFQSKVIPRQQAEYSKPEGKIRCCLLLQQQDNETCWDPVFRGKQKKLGRAKNKGGNEITVWLRETQTSVKVHKDAASFCWCSHPWSEWYLEYPYIPDCHENNPVLSLKHYWVESELQGTVQMAGQGRC